LAWPANATAAIAKKQIEMARGVLTRLDAALINNSQLVFNQVYTFLKAQSRLTSE
jgi:hypothetical protein